MFGTILKVLIAKARDPQAEESINADVKRLADLQSDILSAIRLGYDLDTIAASFEKRHGIRRPHTLLLAASFVDDLVQADDDEALGVAKTIAKVQYIDSTVSAADFVKQLHYDTNIFCASKCSASWGETSIKTENGIVVLSTAYLYFFAYEEQEFSYVGAHAKGLGDAVLSVIPGWGHASAIWDVGSTVEGARNFFSMARLEQFAQMLETGHGFAVPLAAISGYRKSAPNDAGQALMVMSGKPKEARYALAQIGEGAGEWVTTWRDTLRLACIAEGNLLRVNR